MTHKEGMLAKDSHIKSRINSEIWAQKGTVIMKIRYWAVEKMLHLATVLDCSTICTYSTLGNALFHARDIIISRARIIRKKNHYGKFRIIIVNCGHFCNVIYYFSHFLEHNVISILSTLLKVDNRDYVISLGMQLHYVDSLTLCFIFFYTYKN